MLKGKVVLVPFPFDDLSTNKVRPAVCLTGPIGLHHHIVLSFISSQIPNDPLDTDIILESSQDDFAVTGLRVSSTLRLHRIMTISDEMIQRELGELTPRMQPEVSKRLKLLFELD